MEPSLVVNKFGGNYKVNEDTYHMGIHHLLADAVAKRFFGHEICLDACLGAGFMTLVLVKYVSKVIGVDANSLHLKQAKYNADLAKVQNQIEFIEGDILRVMENIKRIDSAFLDPDWARAGDNKENHTLSLSLMVPPADALLKKVFKKTSNICLRLPKEFGLRGLNGFPEHEIESVYLDNKLKFHCVYFGDLILNRTDSALKIQTQIPDSNFRLTH